MFNLLIKFIEQNTQQITVDCLQYNNYITSTQTHTITFKPIDTIRTVGIPIYNVRTNTTVYYNYSRWILTTRPTIEFLTTHSKEHIFSDAKHNSIKIMVKSPPKELMKAIGKYAIFTLLFGFPKTVTIDGKIYPLGNIYDLYFMIMMICLFVGGAGLCWMFEFIIIVLRKTSI